MKLQSCVSIFIIIISIFSLLSGQGFPHYQYNYNHLSNKAIKKAVNARNVERGIFEYKNLLKLVEIRSKSYDEAIRLSNVFPGQTNTIPVAIRRKNRLSHSEFSWSCSYCVIDVDGYLENLQNPVSNSQEAQMDHSSVKSQQQMDSTMFSQQESELTDQHSLYTEIIELVNSDCDSSSSKTGKLEDELHEDNAGVTKNATPASSNTVATSLMKEAYEFIWNSFSSTKDNNDFLRDSLNLNTFDEVTVDYQLSPVDEEPFTQVLDNSELFLYANTSNTDFKVNVVEDTVALNIERDKISAPGADYISKESISTALTTNAYFFFSIENWSKYEVDNQNILIGEDVVEEISKSDDESSPEDIIWIPSVQNTYAPAVVSKYVAEADSSDHDQGKDIAIDKAIDLISEEVVKESVLSNEVQESSNISVKSSANHWRDESITLAFSAVRLQLLVGSIAVVFFLCLVLLIRLYHFVVYYPTNLVVWLDEESYNLFAEGNYSKLESVLSYYLPTVEWYFGVKDVETIALTHYFAKSQMALGTYAAANVSLHKLLTVLLPFGEDEYLASIYEDLGFVQHAMGNHHEAIQSLHKALRIISEEQVFRYEIEKGEFLCDKATASIEDINDYDRHVVIDDSDTVVPGMDASAADFLTSNPNKSKDFELEITSVVSTAQKRFNSDAALFSQEDIDALTTSMSPSSTLMNSFGSPSTLDLNEAYFTHSDLNVAVQELETMLGDSNYVPQKYRHSSELASWREENGSDSLKFKEEEIRDCIYGDFVAVPSLEVTRLCKKLGDIYKDMGDITQSRLFYQNAMEVARRLDTTVSMGDIIAELQNLLNNIPMGTFRARSDILSIMGDKYESQTYDPDMYDRFFIDTNM